jgi:hypothetical protein
VRPYNDVRLSYVVTRAANRRALVPEQFCPMKVQVIDFRDLARNRQVSKVPEKNGLCSHYESAALPTELRRHGLGIEPVAILNALSKCVKPHHDVRVALADHLNSHRSGIFSKYYSHFLHSGHPPFSVKVCDSGRPALSHTLFPHGAICVR